MPSEEMTLREIELLAKADAVVARFKSKPRTDFRILHGAYEERAVIFAAEFWQGEAARLAEAILVIQRQSMSSGELD